VERLLILTDRSLDDALPAASALGLDVKVEPLDAESLAHANEVSPSVLVVDAEADPDRAHRLLGTLAAGGSAVPILVVLARADLERLAWGEVADEFVHPGASPAELRLRLGMLVRRRGGLSETVVRLGLLSINIETYQVTAAGRVLDLTFKEFELLRFLVATPGRVFTRSELLTHVWGYDFYGGTRTVDVHVRRLRAKLGPEHEGLIATVRGVGYAAVRPDTTEHGE
jgi:DNA-binding response OmpR family regulator